MGSAEYSAPMRDSATLPERGSSAAQLRVSQTCVAEDNHSRMKRTLRTPPARIKDSGFGPGASERATFRQHSHIFARSAAQSHFIDLCEVLGQKHPAAVDHVGDTFTFEKHVSKLDGGKGC